MDKEHKETLELMRHFFNEFESFDKGDLNYEIHMPSNRKIKNLYERCIERMKLLEPKETHVDYSDLETMVESILSSLYDIKNNKASEYNYDQCADWLEENKYLMFPERQEIEGLLDYIGRR